MHVITPVRELLPIFRTMGSISSMDFFIGVSRSKFSDESPSLTSSFACFGAIGYVNSYTKPLLISLVNIRVVYIHGRESWASLELRKTLNEDFLDRTGDKVPSAVGTILLLRCEVGATDFKMSLLKRFLFTFTGGLCISPCISE
jgi:hypothetical protein